MLTRGLCGLQTLLSWPCSSWELRGYSLRPRPALMVPGEGDPHCLVCRYLFPCGSAWFHHVSGSWGFWPNSSAKGSWVTQAKL